MNTPSQHLPILRPRITEKATFLSARENKPVYTFVVDPRATKATVAKAVKELYKVTPATVRIVRLPVKNVMAQGRAGTKGGVKKALVTLKKGEKIESL